IDKDRDVLKKMGFQITELDLDKASSDEMQQQLEGSDIVYVAGGNTCYLLKRVRETGFDKMLEEFVYNGGLYAGASAGALIAGPDIGAVSTIDEPEKVQGLKSTKGFGWIDIVPIPHYDMKARTKSIDEITAKYKDHETTLLTDDQAIVVDGSNWKVVDLS